MRSSYMWKGGQKKQQQELRKDEDINKRTGAILSHVM